MAARNLQKEANDKNELRCTSLGYSLIKSPKHILCKTKKHMLVTKIWLNATSSPRTSSIMKLTTQMYHEGTLDAALTASENLEHIIFKALSEGQKRKKP